MSVNGVTRSAEWREVERSAGDVRRRLERLLRRELVHDARTSSARLHNVVAEDLADEAFAWALENWKAKPATTAPEQWMRRRALQILDESIDREALVAESREEERDVERRFLAHELLKDDDERAGWLEVAELALRRRRASSDGTEEVPFEALECDPLVCSPADRLDERETFVELERSLLRLPELRRRAIAHRYFDGLAVEEIAYLLDVPVADIRSEIHQGLTDLHHGLAARI
jgi:DNA-directed RNA polymerase specialized sigma24 family protein